MFYEPKKNNHGLKKNPFKSCTVPRVIGWISTKNEEFKDKFDYCGLEKAESKIVDVARVKASPVQYEIKYVQTLRLPGVDKLNTIDIIIGEVVGIHVKDEFITDEDKVDVCKNRPS